MRELWAYARSHRRALVAGLLVSLVASLGALAQPLAAQSVVDALGSSRTLSTPLTVLTALVGISAVATGAATWILDRTGERVVFAIRRRLSFRLTRLRVAELDRHTSGDLIARATSDSGLIRSAATNGLVELVDGTLSFVATFLLMFVLDARLALVTLVVLVVVGAVVGFILPRIREAVSRAQNEVGLLGSALDRALGAARAVKANGAEARETQRIDDASQRSYQAGLTSARYSALVATVSELSLQVSFLVVLGLGGAFVAAGSLPVSTLVAFLLALFYLSAPLTSLSGGLTEVQSGLGAVARLREVAELEIEGDVDTADTADTADTPGAPVPARSPGGSAIEVRGLSFTYPGRSPALRDLDLDVPANQIVALVGPSGSGKSTFFALLQRFYEPDSGHIAFDGRDIATMSRADLRTQLAWVDQDSSTVAGSLAENLRFGAPQATDDDLRAALRAVRLDDLVAALPDGLESDLRERGSSLSGGERQRLALARALLRRPAVLLLDEVTSQVDTASERALWETITSISAHTTVVMIAHRMTTVAAADTIAVLDRGRLLDFGTHDELLVGNRVYRDLVNTTLVPSDTR